MTWLQASKLPIFRPCALIWFSLGGTEQSEKSKLEVYLKNDYFNFFSLRKDKNQGCTPRTAATFQNAAKTKLESSLDIQTKIQFGRPN